MPAYIPSSDLKTILHSKRANLYYLEHCRILVNGGRVEYVTEQGKESLYWNIPIANTTCILLGTGTSVTQAAVRELSKAGVVIGFCGGGGTPLFAGCEVEFFSPQSEYRPTEYLQRWCGFWFDDAKRLAAAKHLQAARLKTVAQIWPQTDWQPDSGQTAHGFGQAFGCKRQLFAYAQRRSLVVESDGGKLHGSVARIGMCVRAYYRTNQP